MEKNKASGTFAFCLGVVFIGLAAQTASFIKDDSLVFPSVFEILRAFFRLFFSAQTHKFIFTSAVHLFFALILAFCLGTIFGIFAGISRFFYRFCTPFVLFLRSIPMLVLVVLSMVLMDYSLVPIIAPFLVLFPMIFEATSEGFVNLDKDLLDVCRLFCGFSPKVAFSVHIPLMAGFLKQAYINAVGTGIKLVISAEYLVQTRNSLGKAVNSSAYFNEYQDIYAYALLMILLVLVFGELPLWIIKKFAAKSRKN